MRNCNLERTDDGTITCPTCAQPYVLSPRELELWQGDLSKSKRPCQLVGPQGEARAKVKPERPSLPPLLKRISNFSKAAITQAMGKGATCTDDEIAARHAICIACELYRPDEDNPQVGYCTHKDCGCRVKKAKGYISKLGWRTTTCPLGEWPELS